MKRPTRNTNTYSVHDLRSLATATCLTMVLKGS